LPLGATQSRELGVLATRVARDPVDLFNRQENPVRAFEAELQVVARRVRAAHGTPHHAAVAGDAVIDMDHQVARHQPFQEVARHDPPKGPRTAHADAAEKLPVGEDDQAVRPVLETAVEAALDQRHRARGGRLQKAGRGSNQRSGLLEELREARGLVGRDHHALALRLPAGQGLRDPRYALGRQRRFAPAERVATRRRARGLALPGQLQGGGSLPGTLPRPLLDVGPRPARRHVPLLLQFGPPLVGLLPQELGGLPDIPGLVKEPDRLAQVVESGGRRQDARPHFGAVAQRAGRGHPVAVVGKQRGQALGQTSQALPQPGFRLRRDPELAGGQHRDVVDRAGGTLVRGVEGPQRVDLVAEELRPNRVRLARRKQVHDAAPPGQLPSAAHLRHRLVAEVEELAQEPFLTELRAAPQDQGLGRDLFRGQGVLQQ
jgi:hypothetical protein